MTDVPLLSRGDHTSPAAPFLPQGAQAWMVEEDDTPAMKKHLKALLEQKQQPKNTTPQLGEWSRMALTKHLVEVVLG